MFHFGNQCIQALNQPFHFDVGDDPATYSEDCLYLNVFVPEAERGEKLPVLVWIHGGGYTGGEIEHLTVSESH